MQSRGSVPRQPIPSRISAVMLAMLGTMATVYVAGRLWQDAQNRVYLIKELDRRTGQGQSSISVDDTLKLVDCRHQHKKLAALEMELASARHEGFAGQYSSDTNGTYSRRKILVVIGITTGFGRRKQRDAVRKSWLPTGSAMKKIELEKGVVARFVIGRSANPGDSFDREIADENRQTKDLIILDNLSETSEERSEKTKLFFVYATETWDAEFYAKVIDDVYVNIDPLGAMLATHLDKPRAYIGCMKSGEVFSESNHKWFEPECWKFGDGKSYFRHASGEMLVVSRAVAQFISINRSILRTYAHDDVSVGSWMIGLDVKHARKLGPSASIWETIAILFEKNYNFAKSLHAALCKEPL